jgi:hypothetical protein
MSDPDGQKANLILMLDKARDSMHAVVARATYHQTIYPPWTIKEVIAHLTGWDDAVIASLKAHTAGDVPGTPANRGINHYNAATVTERESLSYQQTFDEWEATRKILKQTILDLPAEKLSVPLVYPWGPSGTVEKLIRIFADHETEHANEITKILDRAQTG